ncbi:MAG: hypothetical protein ACRDD3_11535 [Azovibrio sp.]
MKTIGLFILALLASSTAMAQYVSYPKDAQVLSFPGRLVPHDGEKTIEYDMTGYLLPSEGLPTPVVVRFIDHPVHGTQPVDLHSTNPVETGQTPPK